MFYWPKLGPRFDWWFTVFWLLDNKLDWRFTGFRLPDQRWGPGLTDDLQHSGSWTTNSTDDLYAGFLLPDQNCGQRLTDDLQHSGCLTHFVRDTQPKLDWCFPPPDLPHIYILFLLNSWLYIYIYIYIWIDLVFGDCEALPSGYIYIYMHLTCEGTRL